MPDAMFSVQNYFQFGIISIYFTVFFMDSLNNVKLFHSAGGQGYVLPNIQINEYESVAFVEPDVAEQYEKDEFNENVPLESPDDGSNWTDAATQLLLTTYIEVSMDQSLAYKTKRKMWETIADKMNKEHNYKFSRQQVENRYKTLSRGYKRIVDNKKATKSGRGRKKLNVSSKVMQLLEEINKGKDSVHLPNILEDGIDIPCDLLSQELISENILQEEEEDDPTTLPIDREFISITSEESNSQIGSPILDKFSPETCATASQNLRKRKPTIVDQLKIIQKDRAEFQAKLIKCIDDYNVEKKRSNDLLQTTNTILAALVNNAQVPNADNLV